MTAVRVTGSKAEIPYNNDAASLTVSGRSSGLNAIGASLYPEVCMSRYKIRGVGIAFPTASLVRLQWSLSG
jgi:hypothetical protein